MTMMMMAASVIVWYLPESVPGWRRLMVQGQIKRLSRHGNSRALVIDRPILELLGIDEQTDLRMTTDGKRLIIEPVTDAERQAQFQKILKKTGKKNAEIFRRLAK
jgi:antitoxin MazE